MWKIGLVIPVAIVVGAVAMVVRHRQEKQAEEDAYRAENDRIDRLYEERRAEEERLKEAAERRQREVDEAAAEERRRADELVRNARYWCAGLVDACAPTQGACETMRDKIAAASTACTPESSAWCFDRSDGATTCWQSEARCIAVRNSIAAEIERRPRYIRPELQEPMPPEPTTACRERQ